MKHNILRKVFVRKTDFITKLQSVELPLIWNLTSSFLKNKNPKMYLKIDTQNV